VHRLVRVKQPERGHGFVDVEVPDDSDPASVDVVVDDVVVERGVVRLHGEPPWQQEEWAPFLITA
jgi:hypothetical protein